MPLLTDNDYDRVMVFIDLRNVDSKCRIGPDFAVDYYRLVLDLVGRRKLMAAYVFDSTLTINGKCNTTAFHDRLRYLGFRVITKELKRIDEKDCTGNVIHTRYEQKEVDVAMACEMVVHALKDNYDIAIVVSGDRDFVPAVQQIQAAGKRVMVASFSDCFSPEIKQYCDTYVQLDDIPFIKMITDKDRVETSLPTDEEGED